ncbi:hypothetical protein HanIR_Chr08g0346261 [Helianthus annuus]|nr:hypothetical protein HanIR_Chr08g0346261 [Helianthus annuus]
MIITQNLNLSACFIAYVLNNLPTFSNHTTDLISRNQQSNSNYLQFIKLIINRFFCNNSIMNLKQSIKRRCNKIIILSKPIGFLTRTINYHYTLLTPENRVVNSNLGLSFGH